MEHPLTVAQGACLGRMLTSPNSHSRSAAKECKLLEELKRERVRECLGIMIIGQSHAVNMAAFGIKKLAS
jgi:hypothetical protein